MERNRLKFGTQWVTSMTYSMTYLRPFCVQDHLGLFDQCTVLKMAYNSNKTSARRTKWIEIWDSEIQEYIWGTFDLLVFNVILASFGLTSKLPTTRKWMTVDQLKCIEMWHSGVLIWHLWATYKCSMSFGGHFVYLLHCDHVLELNKKPRGLALCLTRWKTMTT